MASGTSVVAYANTPADEIIDHDNNGWIVSQKRSEAIISVVDRLIAVGRDQLEEMGRRASDSVRKKFSLSATVAAHVNLYANLMEKA
jgi:glycosyltransferase involved in cell wall biosynthesis